MLCLYEGKVRTQNLQCGTLLKITGFYYDMKTIIMFVRTPRSGSFRGQWNKKWVLKVIFKL
ncbi:hypothetical protein [Methanobrevibacter cuticularis]|uniref:hypothetical protein n=1 Tax=Methanobrevibacter cuticularis TaxID=47311 RepID=UPI0014708EE5|nr:hypothetical protein [Methanobrevibacter cuticularis]